MRDPLPENIDGEIHQHHSFKHEINWGYVLVAVAVIFAVYKVSPALVPDEEKNQDAEVSPGV